MRKEDYDKFVHDGGRSFTLHLFPPLSTYADRAAEAEARSYKEIFRRSFEEYLQNHHAGLFVIGKEAHDA